MSSYGAEAKERVGFFTDTSVCIGCKACEVACKEWNVIPEDGLVWTGESYDNTSTLGANSWRHVAFVEQRKPLRTDGEPGAEQYPYVATTYRLTEHHTAGGMSRFSPYLSELQPAMFVEVHPDLARERGLEHGGWATIVTARAAIEARVLVTDRVRPVRINGRVHHQVGLPYHWGSRGLTTGGAANDLAHMALDPNVHIQEVKAFTCDIRPGRRPRGPRLPKFVAELRERAR